MPKLSLTHSFSSRIPTWPQDRAAHLVPNDQLTLLRTITGNQRRADDLINFLESSDPGAQLDDDTRQSMLATCRQISNNTSIQNLPVPRFRARASLQLPLKREDMLAVHRDEARLSRMTDQLHLHAHALLEAQTQRVKEGKLSLETLCKGGHPTASKLADQFLREAIPNLKKRSQDAPRIVGEMRFAEQLLNRMAELKTAYQRIHTGYQKVAEFIPMEQHVCGELVHALKRAEHCANQFSMGDCQRFLLQFDVRFLHMKLSGSDPFST